jgi:hypothetical protein
MLMFIVNTLTQGATRKPVILALRVQAMVVRLQKFLLKRDRARI